MIKMLRLKGDKFMTCQRRYVQHGSTKRDKFETCRVQYVQTGSLGPGARSRRKVIFYSWNLHSKWHRVSNKQKNLGGHHQNLHGLR